MIRLLPLVCLLLARPCTADLLDGYEFFDVQLGQKIIMGRVEPDTVRGFEVLYATPGSGDVSEIAGHLLLRIMLDNNPFADEQGIENPHDLVISFLADTEAGKPERALRPVEIMEDCHRRNWFNLVENRSDESPLDSLWQSVRGLTGGFKIIMDLQTLGAALKSYTIEQDRDLLRYRLVLTDDQKRQLLDHLLWVRDHYEPDYYFFSRNCGSVLMQVIGEGIGNAVLADDRRWVSPPHTLLGNMIREGLAERAVPSFYSYRKRGFISRGLFADEWRSLQESHPQIRLPSLRAFFHRNEARRTEALAVLTRLSDEYPALRPAIYRMALLAQEMEMTHSHKDWVCEDYTSTATEEARKLQKTILLEAPIEAKFNLLEAVQGRFAPEEMQEAREGTSHTGSYPLFIGAGVYDDAVGPERGVLTLKTAFLVQEMGAPSRVAMQRQSAIELGGAGLVYGEDGLEEWRFTGLRLTKFRDTLLRVPSALVSTRGLGLGLTVLDVEHRRRIHQTRTTLAGMALLANGISSAHYNQHVFFSAGLDLVLQDEPGNNNFSARFPVGMESLVTFGDQRRFQWRSRVFYSFAADDENRDMLTASSSLDVRIGEWAGTEIRLDVSVDYEKAYERRPGDEERERLTGSGSVQFRRW